MLTIENFDLIPSDAIISSGETTNDSNGIYMTDSRVGEKLKWIAKKGGGPDWAIYTFWANYPDHFVLENGEKVRDPRNIQKLVPCDDEVMEKYRK
jgi:hypothetical protein